MLENAVQEEPVEKSKARDAQKSRKSKDSSWPSLSKSKEFSSQAFMDTVDSLWDLDVLLEDDRSVLELTAACAGDAETVRAAHPLRSGGDGGRDKESGTLVLAPTHCSTLK